MFGHMSNFHRRKVVGRGSETQLQVGENCYSSEVLIYYEIMVGKISQNLHKKK